MTRVPDRIETAAARLRAVALVCALVLQGWATAWTPAFAAGFADATAALSLLCGPAGTADDGTGRMPSPAGPAHDCLACCWSTAVAGPLPSAARTVPPVAVAAPAELRVPDDQAVPGPCGLAPLGSRAPPASA